MKTEENEKLAQWLYEHYHKADYSAGIWKYASDEIKDKYYKEAREIIREINEEAEGKE